MTVARMMMVVWERPLSELLSGAALPPLVLTEDLVTGIPAMEPVKTFWMLVCWEAAELELGLFWVLTSMVTVTEPLTILRTVIEFMLTPAALAIWVRKAR